MANMPYDAQILLSQLRKHGYKHIARDPEDNMLCAYKYLPTLEDGYYTLTETQMDEPYSCFVISPAHIRMFIHDFDVHILSGANLRKCCQIPVSAEDGPICISKLLTES